MTGPPDGLSTDTLLDLLADGQRRAILRRLEYETTPVSLETLHDPSEQVGDEWIVRAHHVHLPKLDRADVVEYDANEKTVRPGHQFEHAVSLLSTINEFLGHGSSGGDAAFGRGPVDE